MRINKFHIKSVPGGPGPPPDQKRGNRAFFNRAFETPFFLQMQCFGFHTFARPYDTICRRTDGIAKKLFSPKVALARKNVAVAIFGKVATANAEFVGFYSILQKNAFATFRFLHLQLFFLHLQFFVADKLLRPQRCANISYLTGTRTYENSKAAFAKKQGFKSTIKKARLTDC